MQKVVKLLRKAWRQRDFTCDIDDAFRGRVQWVKCVQWWRCLFCEQWFSFGMTSAPIQLCLIFRWKSQKQERVDAYGKPIRFNFTDNSILHDESHCIIFFAEKQTALTHGEVVCACTLKIYAIMYIYRYINLWVYMCENWKCTSRLSIINRELTPVTSFMSGSQSVRLCNKFCCCLHFTGSTNHCWFQAKTLHSRLNFVASLRAFATCSDRDTK